MRTIGIQYIPVVSMLNYKMLTRLEAVHAEAKPDVCRDRYRYTIGIQTWLECSQKRGAVALFQVREHYQNNFR